jgi:hypothetical protein
MRKHLYLVRKADSDSMCVQGFFKILILTLPLSSTSNPFPLLPEAELRLPLTRKCLNLIS